MRGCSFLFVVANGERSRPGPRFRTGFIGGDAGSPRFPKPTQIAESEAQGVAEEEENHVKKNADVVKEKEESEGVAQSIGKKEVESIADSVTEKVGISNAGSVAGGGSNSPDNGQDARATIAETAA